MRSAVALRFKISIEQKLVLLLLVMCLLGGVMTGSAIYYRLSYIWVAFLAVNWLWSHFALRGLQFQRKARQLRAQPGQIFIERFEVQNLTRLPRLWLEVRDESPLPGAHTSQVLSQVGSYEVRSYVARTRLSRRGVFLLGPTVLHSSDLFGLFPVYRRFPAQASLLVYPMLVELRLLPETLGQMPGGDALQRRTHQVTPNASSVREYVTGDSFNRIHWVSTARRDRLMVKEFELDPQSDVWILLDADHSVHTECPWSTYGGDSGIFFERSKKIELPPSTEEYAATITASLARYYLRHKRAVGLVSYNEPRTLLPPDRGGRQLMKILEDLALWKTNGHLRLLGMVEVQAPHLLRGSLVILVTPSPHAEVALAADYLLRRGLRPLVILLDLESFGGAAETTVLVERLKLLGLPVCKIAYGDNLAKALSVV